MSSSVDRIKRLVPSLPESDIKLGNRFLNCRDFESLKLLVDSAIIRVKKGLEKENPKEEYLNTNLRKLNGLKFEVDTYCEALGLTESEDDYDEEESNYY